MSGHNLRMDCHWHNLVLPSNSGANTVPVSVQALFSSLHFDPVSIASLFDLRMGLFAVFYDGLSRISLTVVALKQPIINCSTLSVSHEMN